MQTADLLRKLTDTAGVSGDEFPASEAAAELIRPYAESVETDHMGNVIAVIKKAEKGQKKLLLDAHIDRVGLIVTEVCEKGFLRFESCGGIDKKSLPAQRVCVHAKKPLYGVITAMPPHLQTAEQMKKAVAADEMFIDAGISGEELLKIVAPGDRVTVLYEPSELLNGRATMSAVDDRAGAAAIIKAAELIAQRSTGMGVTALFSAQEETGERGAAAVSGKLEFDELIAVDVSFAYTPDAKKHKCGVMGGGVMIGVSPTLNKTMSDKFVALAKKAGIKYQLEIMSGETGTNADCLGTANGGVKAGLLSIPIKYMHTPCETVELSDIESVCELIAEYITDGERTDV